MSGNIESSVQRRARLRLERGLIDQAEYERQMAVESVQEADLPPTHEQWLYAQSVSGMCF